MNTTEKKVSHTPGPWTFEDMGLNDYGVQFFQIDQHEDAPLDDTLRATCLAEVYANGADAKLIAAAPELLATLEKVRTAIRNSNMKNTILHEEIRRVIKKATE